jgi:phospholipid/cholesterol/gamma-HCH transport system substrate-binding protein
VTLVVIAAVAGGAFFSKYLPIIGNGTTYSAEFTDSAGLVAGNDVQVAGVKVGEVRDVTLDGNRVLVKFTVGDTKLGNSTRASIQIKTLLGEKDLAVQPEGPGSLNPDQPIPASRTAQPYDIPTALNQLGRTAQQINTQQLAQSFQALSSTLSGTPQQVGPVLNGLSKVSESLTQRDAQLTQLLHNTANVSQIVSNRDAQVQALVSDGNLLFQELQERQSAISALLQGTQQLSAQLHGLVTDNQQQLQPALNQLNQVTTMLQRNQTNLNKTLAAMAPYIRGFNNTIGNGRWFDGYMCGLLPPVLNAGPIQGNQQSCEVPNPGGH